VHLLLELADQPLELLRGISGTSTAGAASARGWPRPRRRRVALQREQDVRHLLADRLRVDPVLLVVVASGSRGDGSVSEIARFIESVTSSAYMITVPSTLRAARPIVWMSEVSLRRNPSLSASRIATRAPREVEAPPGAG
jgi:hypothetical protein